MNFLKTLLVVGLSVVSISPKASAMEDLQAQIKELEKQADLMKAIVVIGTEKAKEIVKSVFEICQSKNLSSACYLIPNDVPLDCYLSGCTGGCLCCCTGFYCCIASTILEDYCGPIINVGTIQRCRRILSPLTLTPIGVGSGVLIWACFKK